MMISERDLGELEGSVLVFGGPYSNLAATEAMGKVAKQLGIPVERTLCTGDVVAYCAEPAQTTALVQAWGIPVVLGNCEESLAEDADDCNCGFDTGSSCSLLSLGWYPFARARTTRAQRTWMATLPRALTFRLNGLRFRVVHGGVERINEFVFASDPLPLKRRQLDTAGADVVIGGHCGIPFGQQIDGRYWLNAGVIGLPANDGTPDGWYLLLTPNQEGVVARWHRLHYDAQSSGRAMREAGLDSPYEATLSTGLWPSEDILPPAERRRRGRPLRPRALALIKQGSPGDERG